MMTGERDNAVGSPIRNPSVQETLFEKAREGGTPTQYGDPVECLGLTFENDEARRTYFLGKLRDGLEDLQAKLNGVTYTGIDEAVMRMMSVEHWPMGDESRLRRLAERMRHAESSKDLLQRWKDEVGFPHGEIDAIISLSDPPHFTVCPNPFIRDFIRTYGHPYLSHNDDYHREPFASDVKEGKNNPIYNAHTYHTKVPHNAIMRYVKHYTKPGDILFDGFCGTGMTGVSAITSNDCGNIEDRLHHSLNGRRWPILTDLSPIATFVASNLLRPINRQDFLDGVDSVCATVDSTFGYLYETHHTGWRVRDRKTIEHKIYQHKDDSQGNVEFTIYSDVVQCPNCTTETTLYSIAIDEQKDAFRRNLVCSVCDKLVAESEWEPVFTSLYDPVLNRTIRQKRIVPVLINYSIGTTRYEKFPDEMDLSKLSESLRFLEGLSLPSVRLIKGKETRRNEPSGFTHLHHFFTPREHLFVASLLDTIWKYPNRNVRDTLLFSLTATLPYVSKMRRFRADRKGGGPLSGTLYVGSLITPLHVLKAFRRKASTISESLKYLDNKQTRHVISTQHSGYIDCIQNDSIDYIFTDPPFGSNFDYSELNFFWEGIIRVTTNQAQEAIVSTSQKKGIDKYRDLMEKCFGECHRILKPGRWITVVFSNTKASVWNAIQSALERSGFVVANVSTLDKKQHSFKAVTTLTAVRQDLVISAYKPNGGLEDRFGLTAGTASGVWDFVHTHLGQLPVFSLRDGRSEIIQERQHFLLFDRMVAFHVQRNVTVPISAAEFHTELGVRFPERDGMVFLPEQVVEYDRKRMAAQGVAQLEIFVKDEMSAIQWLRWHLNRKPQSFQDIHPQFLREIAGWRKHEKLPELSEMLEQNFLRYDGVGEVPSQIHSYLSTNFKELRKLPKDHPALRFKAKDRWYVPDPNKAIDVEKRRTRSLLREFDEYRQSPQRRLKLFRLEAVRAGFFRAYQEQDYATIISVAGKIPDAVLQEDQKLMLWYDQALTRAGAGT